MAFYPYVRGKWWPSAESNAVGPIAWRMAENGHLERLKRGEYALPKQEREQIRARTEKEAAKMPWETPQGQQ